MSDNPLKTQVAGNHYSSMKIQPVEYSHANGLGFIEGNVVKYISRYKSKNGREDLEKIKHCIDLLISLEYGDDSIENSSIELGDELISKGCRYFNRGEKVIVVEINQANIGVTTPDVLTSVNPIMYGLTELSLYFTKG